MATFYRLVNAEVPMVEDFLSIEALGRPLRSRDPDVIRLASGISVYSSIKGDREVMERFPRLGRFIAEVNVEEAPYIRLEQSTDDPGHHTIWAEPDRLLEAVVRVLPP